MKRVKILMGQRRMQVLVTMAVLLLAAGVIYASSASFTASSTNVSNQFTAGNLKLDDTSAGNQTLTFTAAKLWPGHDITGTAIMNVISDGGSADLYLKRTSLTNDVQGPGGQNLSDVVTLTVSDGASIVYGPTLMSDSALATGVNLETIAATGATGVSHTFTFTVSFPNGDDGSLANGGADNPYMNTQSTAGYQFTAVSQ
jgi:hypothetical protein